MTANQLLALLKSTIIVDDDGTTRWFVNGLRHREDGPAVIYEGGGKQWYINGELHREDGPAVVHADGTKCWYVNGKLHREDGPAVVHADGRKEWYINGERLLLSSKKHRYSLILCVSKQRLTCDLFRLTFWLKSV